MLKQRKSDIFNLGNGNRFLVKEIIKASEKVTKKQLMPLIVREELEILLF